MLKKIVMILILLAPAVLLANPSPLGITLGSTGCENALAILNKKTAMKKVEKSSEYPEIKAYMGDASNLPFEHALKIYLFCSKDNKVAAIDIELNKGEFSENYQRYYQELSKKYQLLQSQNPFVGNKFAVFKSGDSTIKLQSTHMSFNMDLLYTTNETLEKIKSHVDKKISVQKNQKYKICEHIK